MSEEKPNYAQINRKVWNTSCFRSLSKEARDLFFYLTTCPQRRIRISKNRKTINQTNSTEV
jgi:hypothetical protein